MSFPDNKFLADIVLFRRGGTFSGFGSSLSSSTFFPAFRGFVGRGRREGVDWFGSWFSRSSLKAFEAAVFGLSGDAGRSGAAMRPPLLFSLFSSLKRRNQEGKFAPFRLHQNANFLVRQCKFDTCDCCFFLRKAISLSSISSTSPGCAIDHSNRKNKKMNFSMFSSEPWG